MEMKAAEIKQSYESAANPVKQIQILADLNLCSQEDIRNILIEQGISEEELPKKRGRKKKQEPVQETTLTKLNVEIEPKICLPTMVRAVLNGAIYEKNHSIEVLQVERNKLDEQIKTLQAEVSELSTFLGEYDE